MAEEVQVLGYVFTNPEEGKRAKKEVAAIRVIAGQLGDSDAKAVLELYRGLVEQRFFQTVIGYDFLQQLRENLLSSGEFSSEQIPDIPEDMLANSSAVTADERKQVKKAPSGSGSREVPKNDQKKPAASSAGKPKKGKKPSADFKDEKKSGGKKGRRKKDHQLSKEELLAAVRKYRLRSRILAALVLILLAGVIAMFVIAYTSDSPTILNYKTALENQYASWDEELRAREQAVREKERELKLNSREEESEESEDAADDGISGSETEL